LLVEGTNKSMEVIIDVGYGVTFSVQIDEQSGYLFHMYQYGGNEAIIDLKMLLKNVSDISITNYAYFLRGTSTTVIIDQDNMMESLEIYHITEDKNYFSYLISQLHKFWTLLSPVLYSNDVNSNVKRDVYLHCPHLLLPKLYLNNKLFMDEWIKLNIDKEIILNGNEKFKYGTTEQKSVNDTYNNTANKDKINQQIMFAQGAKIHQRSYNDKGQGETKIIDKDNVTRSIESYINGLKFGPVFSYDENTIKKIQYYLINNKEEGVETSFYPSGQIWTETQYHNCVVNGTFKDWYDDTNHTLKKVGEFQDGKHVGVSKYFYLDGDHIDITYDDEYYHTLIFFDATNKLTDKIIYGYPTVRIFYNDNGEVVEEKTYGPNWSYDVETREEFGDEG
jgi:antitoxin component YwqK of YwqJK toxin-antitoxin module